MSVAIGCDATASILYTPLTRVTPKIEFSKIFVFRSFRSAEMFVQREGGDADLEIWECETEEASPMNFRALVCEESIEFFWKAKLNPCCCYSTPYGTYGATAVKLTKRAERRS